MSLPVMDAAVPAILELGFLATSKNACHNHGLVRQLPIMRNLQLATRIFQLATHIFQLTLSLDPCFTSPLLFVHELHATQYNTTH